MFLHPGKSCQRRKLSSRIRGGMQRRYFLHALSSNNDLRMRVRLTLVRRLFL
jgi:hypothetical protein